jgi:hypothetical protein
MKLVDILARELKVWPYGVAAIAQGAATHELYDSSFQLIEPGIKVSVADDRGHPGYQPGAEFITRAQWQAAVDALEAEKVIEWNGEGLPPVGMVCEAMNPIECRWLKVRILDHEGSVLTAVCRGEDNRLWWAQRFRPIRTAEQIAAEEREAELNRMVATVSMLDKGWARKVCAGLYDAGYRKLESVEE